MEASLGQHPDKLTLGTLVDGHGHQLAFSTDDEALGKAINAEEFVHLAVRVEQDGRMIAHSPDEGVDLDGVLVGDGEDHQALRLEASIDRVEVGHLQAAGWAPGGPEVDHNDFAAEFRERDHLAVQVSEGEVGLLDFGVVIGQYLTGLDEERVVESSGDALITD